MMKSVNPATGETLAEYSLLDEAQIEAKLALAAAGFSAWSALPTEDRANYLRSIAAVMQEGKQRLARLIVAEMGKPLAAAVAEVEKCAYTLRFYADEGPALLKPEAASFPNAEAAVHFLPLGPLLGVMPWNFPLFQVVRFLAPALISGNTVLLKHAGNVPQAALALEDVCNKAGLPAGVFQALLISAKMVTPLIADRRIAAVTLTGSEHAGRSVAAEAGKALKKVVLELGGSDPLIVMPSADVPAAARAAVKSRMSNNGQSCICAKRFIVADEVYEAFREAVLATVAGLKVGDPLAEGTDIGPLISARAREEIHGQVQSAVRSGGRVLAGGTIPEGEGFFYPATVIADIPEGAAIGQEEFFGPVALLYRASDRHHALRLANDSPFGLGSSVWTRDEDDIAFFTTGIQAGMTFVNAMVASDPHVPFGGVKLSGYGREFGAYGLREFVNIKTVVTARPLPSRRTIVTAPCASRASMIVEIAEIDVRPGTEDDFCRGVKTATPLFLEARGCHRLELKRSIEHPRRFRLLVNWDAVQDHEHFRQTDAFTKWRSLVSDFFSAPPRVEHVTGLVAEDRRNNGARTAVVKVAEVEVFSRGNGVETTLLIGHANAGARFTTGLTKFPPGASAPMHFHNCDEQVTILDGIAEVQVADMTDRLARHDSTFIPAGLPHRFVNVGEGPLAILWIYDTPHVTRTFVDTGVTVEHLSGGDKVQ